MNARFGHAVPRDPSITELRVSWVFAPGGKDLPTLDLYDAVLDF